MVKDQIKWPLTWMNIAKEIANRSKDNSTKVGAVLVKGKKQLSLAFNGPPPLISDAFDWNDRDLKLSLCFHAESNALWFAADSHGIQEMEGATMYCTTKPCAKCVLESVRAKLRGIVYDERTIQPKMLTHEEWAKSLDIAYRGNLELIPYGELK